MLDRKYLILMVCRQNICRSPLAEAILRHQAKQMGLSQQLKIDSAATHADMAGTKPDPRVVKIASRGGVKVQRSKSRPISEMDFQQFDYILVMDKCNYQDILAICPQQFLDKIQLLMKFSANTELDEVPDPYYGNMKGFEKVFELISDACTGFLNTLVQQRIDSANISK